MSFRYLVPHLLTNSTHSRGECRLDADEGAELYQQAFHSCLKHYAEGAKRPFIAIEIGRFGGGFTVLLAHALNVAFFAAGGNAKFGEELAPKLYSIASTPQEDKELLQTLADWNFSVGVQFVVGNSMQIPFGERFKTLDLVFLDGSHDYEAARLHHMKYGVRLKVGGLIIHHDVSESSEGDTSVAALKHLREDIVRSQPTCVKLVEETAGLAVFERRGACWRAVMPTAVVSTQGNNK